MRLSVAAALIALCLSAVPAGAQEELSRALSKLPVTVGQPVVYQRKGKENIYRLARKHGVSLNAVHNANAGKLSTGGETLLLPTHHIAPLATASGIVVNLPERNVYLYTDGKPVKVFPVAIGRRGFETPTGTFRVVNKRKNPTWFPPKWAEEEEPVPPGPDNPLGDRWIGTSAPGIGLHATNAPASVGRVASHGCMRMYPEQVHELYGLVSIGTPVKIVYQLASVGYDPADGVVYLAHFPNPYQKPEVTADDVRKQLEEYGLADVADLDAIEKTLARTRGVPAPIVGTETKVVVGGRPLKLALAPVRENDEWLVPLAPLAEALGAIADIGPAGSYALLLRGDQSLRFEPGESEAQVNGEPQPLAAPMRLAAGYPLVPLRATVTALGGSLTWDDETKSVVVWDALAPRNTFLPGQ